MGQAFLQMHNRLAFVGLGERGGTAKIRSELGTRAIPLPLEPAHRLVRERRVGRSPLPLEPAEGRGREEKGAREEEVDAPTAQPASSCTPDALRAAQAANPTDPAARTSDPVTTAWIELPPRLQDRSPVITARKQPPGGEASPDQPPPDLADEHADPATPALKRQTATTKQVDRSNCSHREKEGERGCERAAVAVPLRRKGGGGARGERRGGRGGRLRRPLARSRQPPSPWPLLASGGGDSVEERKRGEGKRSSEDIFRLCSRIYSQSHL